MPATIFTDSLRLKQLLMNLMGNAVKFTEGGEVHLVCRLAGGPQRTQFAFDIVDTGVGIAADKPETIFDAFAQADNSVTREFGGTGLGLAISRRIAQAMGGDITVKSEPGKGQHLHGHGERRLAGGRRDRHRPGGRRSDRPA